MSTKSKRKSLCQPSTSQVGICFTYLESVSKNTSKQLEQVQRNAARWVTNQPYNPHNPSSVTEMINHLKWPSLQQRRVWVDVTLMYKVVNCLIAVPVNYHPTTATVLSTRRSHSMKFIPIQPWINAYQNSFFPRTNTT